MIWLFSHLFPSSIFFLCFFILIFALLYCVRACRRFGLWRKYGRKRLWKRAAPAQAQRTSPAAGFSRLCLVKTNLYTFNVACSCQAHFSDQDFIYSPAHTACVRVCVRVCACVCLCFFHASICCVLFFSLSLIGLGGSGALSGVVGSVGGGSGTNTSTGNVSGALVADASLRGATAVVRYLDIYFHLLS